MLEPLRHVLEQKTIILASGSTSRRDALENIGLHVMMMPSNADETLDQSSYSPEKYVEIIATRKVQEVEDRLLREGHQFDLIIGADTVVSVDGNIRCKPQDRNDAIQKVQSLSGRSNEVYTGVVLKQPHRPLDFFVQKTTVFFGEMTAAQVEAYVDTGEPMNVAGGYAIQGKGGSFIEKIEGNYFNVLGMPHHKLCTKICEIFSE